MSARAILLESLTVSLFVQVETLEALPVQATIGHLFVGRRRAWLAGGQFGVFFQRNAKHRPDAVLLTV